MKTLSNLPYTYITTSPTSLCCRAADVELCIESLRADMTKSLDSVEKRQEKSQKAVETRDLIDSKERDVEL